MIMLERNRGVVASAGITWRIEMDVQTICDTIGPTTVGRISRPFHFIVARGHHNHWRTHTIEHSLDIARNVQCLAVTRAAHAISLPWWRDVEFELHAFFWVGRHNSTNHHPTRLDRARSLIKATLPDSQSG